MKKKPKSRAKKPARARNQAKHQAKYKVKARHKANARRGKKPVRKSSAKSAGQAVTKLLQTAFMSDFEKEFLNNADSALNWPGTAQGQRLADEFNLFSRVLFESAFGHRQASEIAVTPTNATLHQRLVTFLDGYQNPGGKTTGGWSKQDATIAGSGGKKDITHKTVRLWEVAGLLQSLLGGVATAQQVTDGGGDPVKWPPHMSF